MHWDISAEELDAGNRMGYIPPYDLLLRQARTDTQPKSSLSGLDAGTERVILKKITIFRASWAHQPVWPLFFNFMGVPGGFIVFYPHFLSLYLFFFFFYFLFYLLHLINSKDWGYYQFASDVRIPWEFRQKFWMGMQNGFWCEISTASLKNRYTEPNMKLFQYYKVHLVPKETSVSRWYTYFYWIRNI